MFWKFSDNFRKSRKLFYWHSQVYYRLPNVQEFCSYAKGLNTEFVNVFYYIILERERVDPFTYTISYLLHKLGRGS